MDTKGCIASLVVIGYFTLVLVYLILILFKIVKVLVNTEKRRDDIIYYIIDIEPEIACEYCETFIIEGSRNSWHFQCEGRYCEQAHEGFFEEMTNVEIRDLLIY